MAHKELKYAADARKALELGVDAVANAVKVTLGGGGQLPLSLRARTTHGYNVCVSHGSVLVPKSGSPLAASASQ
jgi:hypothetical protein